MGKMYLMEYCAGYFVSLIIVAITGSRMKENVSQKGISILSRISFAGLGGYLLIGAYFVWTTKHWPAFMPPQLDILGMLFNLAGDDVGVFLNILLLSILGFILLLLAVLPAKRR